MVKKALAVYPGPSSLYQGIDLSQANASDLARMIASDPNRAKATASTSTLVIMPAALSHRNTLGLAQTEEACLELLIGISMRVARRCSTSTRWNITMQQNLWQQCLLL